MATLPKAYRQKALKQHGDEALCGHVDSKLLCKSKYYLRENQNIMVEFIIKTCFACLRSLGVCEKYYGKVSRLCSFFIIFAA